MKKIKQVDLWLQLAALVLSLVYVLFGPYEFSFIIMYFAVGGVQVLSFLGHLAAGTQTGLTTGRKRYGLFLLVVALLLLTGWVLELSGLLMVVLVILLIVSPFIAMFYAAMCFDELRLLRQNETAIDNMLKPVNHETI